MTVITDVPESGIYTQVGAIIQIVAQLIDVNTGLPVNLQEATNLSISLLYPDHVTARDLPATLYTDGSDGCIAYLTQNDGASNIDLTQVGLYQFQGNATIGSVPLPPSMMDAGGDFYVKANVMASGTPPIAYTSSALIFFDSNNTRWAMTVSTGGTISNPSTAQLTGPINSLHLNQVVLKDSDGVYWTVTMGTDGHYVATQGGTFEQAITNLVLLDSNSVAWVVTISTLGVLSAH